MMWAAEPYNRVDGRYALRSVFLKVPTRPGQTSVRMSAPRMLLGYVCAVLVEYLAADLAVRTHMLHGTPLALNFIGAAMITLLFGFGPGIFAVLLAAAIFYYRFMLPGSPPWDEGNLIRTALIVLVGTVVVFFSNRQRVTRVQLRGALEALGEHADTLAQAQQGSHSAAWVLRAEDGDIHWAPGGAELLGRPFEEASTLEALRELIYAEDRERVQRAAENAFYAGAAFHAEFRVVLPSGELRWLEARGTPSATDQRWRGVVLDVTSRKQAELALLRAEKLAAIGRLSSTVAHEINNPLEATTNLLYLAQGDPELKPQTRAYLEEADHELRRLASIARHTLTFARSRPALRVTDAAPIAESVVTMFQTRCKSRGGQVRLRTHSDARVDIPPDELRQILTNLLSNACDALNGTDGLVDVEVSADDDTMVVLVRDTGSGIASEHLERVFDPFFTTKDDFGTGIGLWVARELAEKNGGRITAASGDALAPFRTSFRVELPLEKTVAEAQL